MTPLGSQPTSKLFLALAFMFGFVFGSLISVFVMAAFTKLLDPGNMKRDHLGFLVNSKDERKEGASGKTPGQGEAGMVSDGAARTS